MPKLIFRRAYLALLPILLVFTSCLPPAFFVQAIRIIGTQASRVVLIEASEKLMDYGFNYFFGVVAESTANPVQSDIYALPNEPGYGRISTDQHYVIQGTTKAGQSMQPNYITVDKKHLKYQRTNDGNWRLTTNSKHYVQERLTVASCQQSLIGMGYPTGPIDGHYGPKTANSVKMFKRNNSAYYAGKRLDGTLDETTRSYLLEY